MKYHQQPGDKDIEADNRQADIQYWQRDGIDTKKLFVRRRADDDANVGAQQEKSNIDIADMAAGVGGDSGEVFCP